MYFGWYYLTVYQLNFFLDAMYHSNINNPWIITEFGADAKYGITDPNIKSSEANQARLISYSIKVFNSKPYIAGWFIWLYRDFRSPMRLNPFQQGYNRKGIVDEQNRPKLIARVIKRIIKEKLPYIRHYRALAYLFNLIGRWLERLIMIFIGMGFHFQAKKIRQQYRTTRDTQNL
jgi:hypothetical protein